MSEAEVSNYQNSKTGMNEVENAIHTEVSRLTQAFLRIPKSNRLITDLTRDITLTLANLPAQLKDLLPLGTIGRAKGLSGEFMYDVTWITETPETKFIREVVLVCESELSDMKTEQMLEDFSKLLISNSFYRLFICRAEPNFIYPSNVNNRIAYFDRAVAACQNLRPGDRVLVLIWDDWKTGEVFPHLIVKN